MLKTTWYVLCSFYQSVKEPLFTWSISKKTRSFVPRVAGCCVQIFSLHLWSCSKTNRLYLQKIHKALQVLYLLTVVYYTLSNGYRKRGMRGLWSKTGFVQHLNHSRWMTNQLKDSSTRDGNLWSVCCFAGVLLPFWEFFLMVKSGLLHWNPISSCLAYDRHGGHAISFLFAAAFCVFNDCYSPLSPSSVSECTLFNPFQTSDWSYCTSLISFQLGTAFRLHSAPTTACCSS